MHKHTRYAYADDIYTRRHRNRKSKWVREKSYRIFSYPVYSSERVNVLRLFRSERLRADSLGIQETFSIWTLIFVEKRRLSVISESRLYLSLSISIERLGKLSGSGIPFQFLFALLILRNMVFTWHMLHSWHDRHKRSVHQESGVRRAISKLRYRDHMKLLKLDYSHIILIELN